VIHSSSPEKSSGKCKLDVDGNHGSARIRNMEVYPMPSFYDLSGGCRRTFDFDDEQRWVENSLYARRHDGLYESRLERMQREFEEESEENSSHFNMDV